MGHDLKQKICDECGKDQIENVNIYGTKAPFTGWLFGGRVGTRDYDRKINGPWQFCGVPCNIRFLEKLKPLNGNGK